MTPPRLATETRLQPGRPSRARSANTRLPAGRPHTPPADRMYATDVRQTSDVRQTDVRQYHRLMPPGRGHNKAWPHVVHKTKVHGNEAFTLSSGQVHRATAHGQVPRATAHALVGFRQ